MVRILLRTVLRTDGKEFANSTVLYANQSANYPQYSLALPLQTTLDSIASN